MPKIIPSILIRIKLSWSVEKQGHLTADGNKQKHEIKIIVDNKKTWQQGVNLYLTNDIIILYLECQNRKCFYDTE
jgi:hypothetical protein